MALWGLFIILLTLNHVHNLHLHLHTQTLRNRKKGEKMNRCLSLKNEDASHVIRTDSSTNIHIHGIWSEASFLVSQSHFTCKFLENKRDFKLSVLQCVASDLFVTQNSFGGGRVFANQEVFWV